MSNIYAKWNDMKNISDHISSYKTKIEVCSGKVRNIKNNLRMSDNISYAIISKLSRDEENLNKLRTDFIQYAQVLNSIADEYKLTEERNQRK